MRPDGDAWQAMEAVVEQRGRHSSRGTKVKRHATEEDVRSGAVALADKQGNDIADRMVHRGSMTSGERKRALCQLHDTRRDEYSNQVGGVQKTTLAIIEATRKRRGDMTGNIFGGGGRRLKLAHVVAPTLGEQHEARSIRRTARMGGAAEAASAKGWRGSIPSYLVSLEWRPVS